MTWLRHLERPCFERERVWLAVQSHVSLYWGWLQMTMVGISWLGTLWVAWYVGPGETWIFLMCRAFDCEDTNTNHPTHVSYTHVQECHQIKTRHIMTITNNNYQSRWWIFKWHHHLEIWPFHESPFEMHQWLQLWWSFERLKWSGTLIHGNSKHSE